ncbi:MAG: hypothetical protein ACFCVE_01590 [Phycisphaerae bacterium]
MSEADPPEIPSFTNPTKLERQMVQRGWTKAMIAEALCTPPETCTGKLGPALRYTHPSGRRLMVDARTGEIFHLGKEGYRYDD